MPRHWTMPRRFSAPTTRPITPCSLWSEFQNRSGLGIDQEVFRRYSGAADAPAPRTSSEPEPKAERRKTHRRRFRANAASRYRVQDSAGQHAGLVCIGYCSGRFLSSGVSSRLYQKFVKEKEMALSVYADAEERRGPSLFWFSVHGAADHRSRRFGKTALRRDRAHCRNHRWKIRS